MDTLLQDFRYAVRKLVKTPGFTFIAGFTLALAIGANTAIFSVVDGVLLQPLPFPKPEQLVRASSFRDGKPSPTSVPDFIDFREQSRSFVGLAAITDQTMNLTGGAEPERLESARVSANFFQILGVSAARGRGFVEGEDKAGAGRVAVLSDALWRRRFASDPRVIGQHILLDGNQYTVVGIAPRQLTYPDTPDLWTPFVFGEDDLDPSNRGAHWMGAIGRLKDGVTVEQAHQEMATIADRLEKQYPESNTGWKGGAMALHEFVVGDVKPALFVMLGAVGFVLLIACANVANLLLVRASGRETEMAVRTALGAGRWRIVRQLVTESVLLAVLGGAAGALLAVWGVDLLVRFGPENLPRLEEVRVDASVLGFTALIALLTGVLFGVLPALHASRPDLNSMLKEGARGSSGRKGAGRVRSMLVVSEMALAVVLLIGAGLLIRSFSKLLSVDPGFRAERVMTFNVSVPESKYGRFHRMRGVAAEIVDRMKTVPGAQSAAAITGLPMSGWMMRTSMHIRGTPPAKPAERKLVNVAPATPGYFATLGIPLKRGRDFTASDRSGAPIVSVISEEAAKRYFPGQDPIGKYIDLGWTQDTSATPNDTVTMGGEIVGIVGNTKRRDLASEVFPEVYMSYDQVAISEFSVVVRTTADPGTVAAAARAQIRALDPDLPMFGFKQLTELVAESVAQPRFYMTLLGSFAAVALILAAVGIYGVISYTVSQRTREIGIRIALGARREQVVRLVLGQGLTLTLFGVGIGVVAAFWVTRLIASLLFGVGAVDVPTFASVAAVLIGIATFASYIPARRAARVDPVTAIRAD